MRNEADTEPDWWPREYADKFPLWRIWQGISGLLYGRRLLSSPPRVVRAESVEDLLEQVTSEEADIQADGMPRHGAI